MLNFCTSLKGGMGTRCFHRVYKPNSGEKWLNAKIVERTASNNVLVNF